MMNVNMSNISNEELVRVIEKRLRDELSVGILAKYFNYSEYHFSRLFKKKMGISVMEYVCRRRLGVASEEIIRGKNIIYIAMELGWQSHSGFSKAFKKKFGFSPSLLKAMIIELDNVGGSAMNHISLLQTNKHATKEELIIILKQMLTQYGFMYIEEFENLVNFADEVYSGIVRYSGDEYITHTLNVAIILTQLEADINTIKAGLFCDASKKSAKPMSEILSRISQAVGNIVEEVNGKDVDRLACLSDSALMVKIAQRLHNMRTIEFISEEKKIAKVSETVEIYLPMARKLGNYKLIAELNNLAVKGYN